MDSQNLQNGAAENDNVNSSRQRAFDVLASVMLGAGSPEKSWTNGHCPAISNMLTNKTGGFFSVEYQVSEN